MRICKKKGEIVRHYIPRLGTTYLHALTFTIIKKKSIFNPQVQTVIDRHTAIHEISNMIIKGYMFNVRSHTTNKYALHLHFVYTYIHIYV